MPNAMPTATSSTGSGEATPRTPHTPYTPREGEETPLLPAEVHDLGEEGSDMTRDIFFAILRDSNDKLPKAQSLPDVSEILYEDIGA